MSEDRALYGQPEEQGITPGSRLVYGDEEYRAPTHADVVALKAAAGLTGSEIATVAGVLPRTVRKWLAPPEATNSTAIPYAAWRLLLIYTGQDR